MRRAGRVGRPRPYRDHSRVVSIRRLLRRAATRPAQGRRPTRPAQTQGRCLPPRAQVMWRHREGVAHGRQKEKNDGMTRARRIASQLLAHGRHRGRGACGGWSRRRRRDRRHPIVEADADDLGFTPLPVRSEPGFDHVVVIMFENRSFDHMLGWLYESGQEPAGQTFDGLHQGVVQQPGRVGRGRARPRLQRADRPDHGSARSRPRRVLPARQHAALRHDRPREQRRPEESAAGAVEPSEGHVEAAEQRLRQGLHRQLHASRAGASRRPRSTRW